MLVILILVHIPFQVLEKKTKPHIQVDIGGQMKTFAPEEISAMVLTKMKETAEAYLGKKVQITYNKQPPKKDFLS